VKIPVWLFAQLIVESIEKCLVFYFFIFLCPQSLLCFSPGLTLAVLSLCEVYKE